MRVEFSDRTKTLFWREVEVLPRKNELVRVQWDGRIRQFTVLDVKHLYATDGPTEYVVYLGLDF